MAARAGLRRAATKAGRMNTAATACVAVQTTAGLRPRASASVAPPVAGTATTAVLVTQARVGMAAAMADRLSSAAGPTSGAKAVGRASMSRSIRTAAHGARTASRRFPTSSLPGVPAAAKKQTRARVTVVRRRGHAAAGAGKCQASPGLLARRRVAKASDHRARTNCCKACRCSRRCTTARLPP